MATVNKNFVVKNGLVVQGSTATINGKDILTKDVADSYILNLVGGATLVKSVDSIFTVDSNGNLTLNYGTGLTKTNGNLIIDRSTVDSWYDAAGSASTAEQNAKDYADSQISSAIGGLSSQTSTDIQNAIATAESYTDSAITQEISDRNSAISSALSTAESYADNAASAAETAAKNYADSLSVNYDPAGSASTAESNANTYTDNKISDEVIARNNAISSAISTEVSDRNLAISNAIATEVTNRDNAISTALSTAEGYTDTAVANLVDGAPALLNTLNELAAAIADNPNYATDVANLVANKADTTYVDSQDSATLSSAESYTDSAISTEVTNRNSAISTALSTAESYTDSAISTEVSDRNSAISTAVSNVEQYTDNAISNGNSNAEPTYKGVKLGYYTELVSGWNSVSDGSAFVPLSWNTNTWGTAKLTVHVRSGVHTQASEVLVARDSSNNLHITEYAIVTTNGALADISVVISGNDTQLVVTPTAGHDQTEAVASGSVIAWAD